MSEKMIKLQFRKVKSHLNHLDNWNHFTEDGQVGEYPEEIGKEKLADFPLNFTEYMGERAKKKAKPVKLKKEEPDQEPKKVEEEPNKILKESETKTKE